MTTLVVGDVDGEYIYQQKYVLRICNMRNHIHYTICTHVHYTHTHTHQVLKVAQLWN